jgi:hypothetical protein
MTNLTAFHEHRIHLQSLIADGSFGEQTISLS